jgi:hypothetical protein
MRTPLCVAFARRTLAGVMPATVAFSAVWATAAPSQAVLAPVETAQIKLVPQRVVRVDRSALESTFRPPAVPVPAPESALPSTTVPLIAPGERERVLEQFATPAPSARTSAAATTQRAEPVRSAAAASSTRKSNTPSTPNANAPKPPEARDPAALSADASAALARVMQSSDNAGAPFIIIDKRNAHLWLFDAQGQARGHTAVLLGLARGDDTVPGIGDKPLEKIKPGERTTPAGRFIAEAGRNARGDDIYWIDYDSAVSMHRVHDVDRGDRRLERLATPSVADNRISYGCINVPAAFYDQTLLPAIGRARPVVYLLPETRPLNTLFDPGQVAGRSPHATPKGSTWPAPKNGASASPSRSGTS